MVTKTSLFVVIFVGLASFIVAEVIDLRPCSGEEICTIKEVRINPCNENPRPCNFKKGKNASISFDFVPNFTAAKLKNMVYWVNGAGETQFLDMDDDGCKFTSCPTTPGLAQQFNYNMYLGRMLPKGTYPIKWKVWNEEDESQVCCFTATIALKR